MLARARGTQLARYVEAFGGRLDLVVGFGDRTLRTTPAQSATGGTMWDQVQGLYDYLGDVPVEARLLKLTEEVGEVAEAYIGIHGLNKRKGVCKTPGDLLDELADVIITAAIAMTGVAGDAYQARSHFEGHIRTVTTRAGLQAAPADS